MERIHVSVRARPLSPEDAKTSPWRISGNSIFIPNHSSKFEFDQIFGEDCKTADVYQARTKDIVAAAVRGFNGTVFAYGQTSSGKTHTMRGSAGEPGIIPLAVHDLFETIQQDLDREFLLRMSYMEIYNEEINDLLAPEHRKLQIHESLDRGIYVAGLREEIVATPEQVIDLMAFGESHRHIGETNMNLYSSRSHTIFRMIIESRDKSKDEENEGSCDAVRVSVLNLVDLAGSERAAKTGAEGIRLKEGSHINKSLMTLGTVIKKLSEGTESQGGHVPYRDSKLTRILQPALGGNANTAIICNITLAQIHADETKSSLQFASRALRVTNCAHVNEIITDAALLKRQKKEIEELRAKLQDSHSEHLEEEILSLRNKLLQTELERERIALELEEGRKAQAEREKRLQEQAKKIENLSTMVLYSNRDDTRGYIKKEKRRDTWCPGNLLRATLREASSTIQARESAVEPSKFQHHVGPLLSFEELVNESKVGSEDSSKQAEDDKNDASKPCALPNPCALMHVTNRKKQPVKKKSVLMDDKELAVMQAEYEELFLEFETQRTMNEMQIDFLTRKLEENGLGHDLRYDGNASTTSGETCLSLRESEAILVIKQLQEQIKVLEMEKSSIQQNLDSVVELATEQNKCAREKFEELSAQEDARVAQELLASVDSVCKIDDCLDFIFKLSTEVQGIMSEFQESVKLIDTFPVLPGEAFQSFSSLNKMFLDLKSLMHQNTAEQKLIISNHESLHCHMRQKVSELENERLLLHHQSVELQNQIQELKLDAKKNENSLNELLEQQEQKKLELVSQIETLEKEILNLSSSSLVKEKENLRKDLEKTKTKLKDAESKFKNAIQEKTKLEGEKAFAERELKRLHGQKALLERDISKRDSLANKRRDSTADRSSLVFDPRKARAATSDLSMQEDYKKLEVLAFEMEATIASLEEELAITRQEKDEAVSSSETLAFDLEALSEKLRASNLELSMLQEEASGLRLKLEEYESYQKQLESSIKELEEEKENVAMQLTDALLEMEEEKAIWSAKEKASIEAVEEKTKMYSAEIMALSKEMLEVRSELDSCRKDCKALREKLACSEESVNCEKKCRNEKSLEIDQLQKDLEMAIAHSKQSQEILKSYAEKLSSELQQAREEIGALEKELNILKNEREEMLSQTSQLDSGSNLSYDLQSLKDQLLIMEKERDGLIGQIQEHKNHVIELESHEKHMNDLLSDYNIQVAGLSRQLSSFEVKTHNEKAKIRMRLRGTQAKADAYFIRYKEEMEEKDFMNRKYEEASKKLKDKLAFYATETLNLRKQIAEAQGQ